MSKPAKGELYRELKDAGVQFPHHYRDYTVDDLLRIKADLLAAQTKQAEQSFQPQNLQAAYDDLVNEPEQPRIPVTTQQDEVAGLRMNTQKEDEPIRVDPETGYIWYQDEVRKAAFPKPRGRRVLRYNDPGVKTVQVKAGEYTESFEMPGDQNRVAEARITLPSYQVGIYKDPRMPFKIHVYNEQRGFDLFEVEEFYGGSDLVPSDIKRIYVSNVLCYDIRTTVRAIENEARELQLTGLNHR